MTDKADGVLITQRLSGITFQHGDETFTLQEFVQRFMQYDMEIDILAQEIEDTHTELKKRYHDVADDNLSTFAAYIASGYAPEVENWRQADDAYDVRESYGYPSLIKVNPVDGCITVTLPESMFGKMSWWTPPDQTPE